MLAGRMQRAFQGFGKAQQALPLGGQGEAVGAGLLKQQGAQAALQRGDTPGDGGVVHPQALGRAAGLARARHFEEELQVVPVQGAEGSKVFLHDRPAFLSGRVGYLPIYTPNHPQAQALMQCSTLAVSRP